MNAAGEKLLSLTRISERRPSGRFGPNVIPSTLSSGIPSSSRSSRSDFWTGSMLPSSRARLSKPLTSSAPASDDVVELDRVAGAGRSDRERALHRDQELVVQREQLDEAVDGELVRGHRRLGDRIRPVDVLPVEPSRDEAALDVVAEDAAGLPAPTVAGGPSWTSAASAPTKRKWALGVTRRSRSRGSAARRASPRRSGRKADGTNSARSWRPPRSNSRTHGSISRFAKPSEVTTSVAVFVSASPSGSRLAARTAARRVAERRHGDDLDGGGAARDADPERVEAHADLVVGERVEDDRGGAS